MDNYKILRKIGAGTFGQVYIGRNKRKYGEVAIKTIQCETMYHISDIYDREVNPFKKFRHKNLVKVHEAFESSCSITPPFTMHIVFELLDMNLLEFVEKNYPIGY